MEYPWDAMDVIPQPTGLSVQDAQPPFSTRHSPAESESQASAE